MKRTVLLLVGFFGMVMAGCAWVGYGNPMREVVFSGSGERYDVRHAFFIKGCDNKGFCQIDPQHQRVLHFQIGDRGGTGEIKGGGQNPIESLRKAGIRFLPSPNIEVAALKWCTNSAIWQEFRYHGRHFIVPLPADPRATMLCVQKQLPRHFSVYVGDPQGRKLEKLR